ncbi:MAG: site-2 protease family protein [Anaerolineae bacterium]|nr:site-2 protease family protein [Anaerolineae bacterium]
MSPTFAMPFSLVGFALALILATIGHEFGHLVMAKALHIPIKLIAVGLGPILWRRSFANGVQFEWRLVPVGMAVGLLGRRSETGEDRRPWKQDLTVAAGGPIASLLLMAALIVLAIFTRSDPAAQSWLIATAAISLLLAFYNLLPLPGLDGGHILVLSVARLGLRLSPQREAMLHRTGLKLTAMVCMLLLAVRMAGAS